jgi:hypothetical protein
MSRRRVVQRIERQAEKATALVTPTAEDIAWAERQTEELLAAGLRFVDAAELAARACTARIFDRVDAKIQRTLDVRDASRERRMRQAILEQAEARAKLRARETEGQRPTLTASLGELVARRR